MNGKPRVIEDIPRARVECIRCRFVHLLDRNDTWRDFAAPRKPLFYKVELGGVAA